MIMKKLLCVVLFLCLMLTAVSGLALTGQEKEQYFDAAVTELTGWLERPGKSVEVLDSIYSFLEELGGYSCSEGLLYYVRILQMVEQENFGEDMQACFSIVENDRNLDAFFKQKEHASIAPVPVLRAYCDGRQAQSEGRVMDAVECFRQCGGFYDTNSRLMKLIPQAAALEEPLPADEPPFSENGFTVVNVKTFLVSRSVTDGDNAMDILRQLADTPEKYGEIIQQNDYSNVTLAQIRANQPLVLLYYQCDSPMDRSIIMSLSVSLYGQEIGRTEESIALRYSDGIIYADFSRAAGRTNLLSAGQYVYRIDLDGHPAWQGIMNIAE